MAKQPFFTLEDFKVAFNLFCFVYGIGTLGMPGNFARAGLFYGTIALVFMAVTNVYATVLMTKVMLNAPPQVKTFGDVGEWCMGKTGRWLVMVSQVGSCVMLACAFLVLGGQMLTMIFPDSFEGQTWIILMAISLTPFCLVPTLKEGAGAALAGCLGTIIADLIGAALLMHGMKGHPSVPTPKFSLNEIATTFGNLSLAYGAAVVVPQLQREHSQPERMPRIVLVTLTFISVLFLSLSFAGYSSLGCQINGNLLFSVYANPLNPITALGFQPNLGFVIMAFLAMQLHVTIAFKVCMCPVFYVSERLFLGMHDITTQDPEVSACLESSARYIELRSFGSKYSIVSFKDNDTEDDPEAAEYKGNAQRWIPVRIAMIALLTLVSVLLKDKFLDFVDFAGASCTAVSCIILPIVFYFKKMWNQIPLYEKAGGIFMVLVCAFLGAYVTYTSGKHVFAPAHHDPNAPKFKFCEGDFAYHLYYNATEIALQAAESLSDTSM